MPDQFPQLRAAAHANKRKTREKFDFPSTVATPLIPISVSSRISILPALLPSHPFLPFADRTRRGFFEILRLWYKLKFQRGGVYLGGGQRETRVKFGGSSRERREERENWPILRGSIGRTAPFPQASSRCGIIGAPSSDYRNSSPRPNYEFIRAKRFLAIAEDGTFTAEIATVSNYLPTIETRIGTRDGYKFFPNDRSTRFLGAINPTSSWLLHELRVRYSHANYWLIKA